MMEQVSSNLYKFSHVSKESIFGGQDSASFKPNLSLGCFLGKGNLTLLPQLSGTFSAQISSGSLLVDHNIFTVRMTPTSVLSGFNEYGGMDFVITLKKLPPTNKISFGYDTTNLVAYHQPELTAREIAEGTTRPDHVVNSIAFYHTSKGAVRTLADIASRVTTGKALHLYRLKATAADGSWIWANWELGIGNTIILSVDQTFLNTKPYPIILAPIGDTFGYTTIGASAWAGTADYIYTSGDTFLGAAGTGTSMSVHSYDFGANIQAALYDNASPSNLITNAYTGNIALITVWDWYAGNFVGSPSLSAIQYYLAFNITAGAYMKHDSGGTNNGLSAAQTFGTWPATVSWTDTGAKKQWSIYCTYTPGAAFMPKIIFM